MNNEHRMWLKQWVAGTVLRISNQANANRRRLSTGRVGLRILLAHGMSPDAQIRFHRLVEWIEEHYDIGAPADVDALAEGSCQLGQRDKVVFTFDDGDLSDFALAEWLAGRNIQAIYFVIPSYIERTIAEYLDFHAQNGVQAYDFSPPGIPAPRGLSRSQVSEMIAMGHRIAAHNYAHRDLGRLHDAPDLEYEIDRAVDEVSSMVGAECRDFAWGFGHIKHFSKEASSHVQAKCLRVYAAFRGLNVPGISPAIFMRDAIYPYPPMCFSKLCVDGGADHQWTTDREELVRRVGVLGSERSPSN